jgi:hypothetical protein
MRITLFGVLVASVMAGGCNRSEPATPGNALVSTAPPAGDGAAAAVASGRADAPRTAEPVSAGATWREITLPAGTQLAVTLDTTVGSDTSHAEQPVTAHLSRSFHMHGDVVLAEGSRVSGVVTDAEQSAKVKGRAHVAMRFDSLTPSGGDERYAIRTASIGRTAQSTKKKDAVKIGAPAAGGAIIGALFGGKKGALVGTAVGGGAGTAVVLSTRGEEVHLAKGTPLTLKLAAPVTIRVRG